MAHDLKKELDYKEQWATKQFDLYIYPPKADQTWENNNIVILQEPTKGSIARSIYKYCDYGKVNLRRLYPLREEMTGFIVVDVIGNDPYKIQFVPCLNREAILNCEFITSNWIPDGCLKKDLQIFLMRGIKWNYRDKCLIAVWMRWQWDNMYCLFMGY